MLDTPQHTVTQIAPTALSHYVQALTGSIAVFFNGNWCAAKSAMLRDDAATITPLSQASKKERIPFEKYIDKQSTHDGLLIQLHPNTHLKHTLHIVFYEHEQTEHMHHYHNIILGASHSHANIVIHTLSDTQKHTIALINTIHLEDYAQLHWHHLQHLGEHSDHTHNMHVEQQSHSHFTYHQFDVGGHHMHHEIHCALLAEHAHCTLNGLYQLDRQQQVDNISLIEHKAPKCNSREYFKGILNGQSRGVFRGKTYVEPHALHTDAAQYNRNLLLSDRARADSLPALEIYADDVKCAHGATVSQLDADQLFYLQSRGITLEEARQIVCQGFARDMITRVTLADIVPLLKRLLTQQREPHE